MNPLNQNIIGTILDNTYRITAVLGEGGMGVVYKATDINLDKDVAVKMMDTFHARDPEFLRMFKGEAKSLAKLQNQNIVGVYGLRETDLGFCIIMEYVEGCTLADVIKEQGALDIRRVLNIFRQLLNAFEHAHRAGIVHRDIKPGNIMLGANDEVKVTDFGLAKRKVSSAETVTYGKRMGTIPYMSPEQAKGIGDLDARSDIYSIGMTLYECLTGKLPFAEGQSEWDIIQLKIEGKIPPPDKPGIPKELVKVVMKAIQKDAANRYQTAGEMWAAMKHLTFDGESGEGKIEKVSTFKGIYIYAVSAIVLLIFGYFIVRLIGQQRDETTVKGIEQQLPETNKRNAPILYISLDPPGAKIYLNKAFIGVAPLEGLETESRPVALHFEADGYAPVDTNMTLENGRTYSIFRSMVMLDIGRLVVQAIPGGSVFVDGILKSSNISQKASLKLPSGSHKVSFRKAGCGERNVDVEIQKGKSVDATCYFEADVNIQSLDDSDEPLFGSIVIDGINTGMYTPKSGYRLECGTHRISVTRVGYTTIEGTRTAVVKPSQDKNTFEFVFHLRAQQKN